MICFKIEKDNWIVYKFIPDHNHDLVKSSARAMLRSQRHVDEAHANMIENMDNAGIKPCGMYSYFVEVAGGAQNVGFLKHDCDNFLQSKRSNTLEAGDAQSVINHFKKIQANDSSFFYTMQVDCENRMTNFFWIDGISRTDYSHFGDVVIFDTTYRTNKYNMACAPFIGVNHHKQSVLFGCAFLLDETTESFIWLFESFLEAMGGLQPKTIFTDQCQAMANAIKRVFPESQHRLCLWHISQNAAKHLSYYLRQPNFKVLFNRCLYNCEYEQEFEEVWTRLLTKVDISKCSWLKIFYELRQDWCPGFSKNYFSAGILSTQRSESMNNIFRTVTCKTMSLTQFVLRYEKVLERRRWSELQKDFECNQYAPPQVNKLAGMAEQAARVYTHVVFEEFYEELFDSLSVAIEKTNEHSKLNSKRVLDPQRVRARGVTNARLKSQLEKKRCKKYISQARSKSHADKGKATSTSAKDFSTSSTPPPAFGFPYVSQVANDPYISQVTNDNTLPTTFCFPYIYQVPYTQYYEARQAMIVEDEFHDFIWQIA
ncbi:protein FAR1-RELATED SEQUENCE 5-like [Gastrolobium bilobum]|uniref:protein FAR1-RELATED SEQUENCE 5-like n=1 Tax=Gastrolobium bilobum TaxID=150636 RepID=UPI002AB0FC8D|nr:protein FAR1-RELATED SEQUENCE 5-like [Gastrolobium bilobum]